MTTQLLQQCDLSGLVDELNDILEHRLNSLRIKKMKGSIEQKILSLLLASCERGTDISQVEQDLLTRIHHFVDRSEPVLITLSLAVGCKLPNPLKFQDSLNVPSFAWLHLAWFFKLLHQKVQKVYEPGIKVIIFDEAKLFESEMKLQYVDLFLSQVNSLIQKMDSPVEIIPLTKDMIPEIESVSQSSEIPEEIVYAMVCSLPEMQDTVVMDPLYVRKIRDYLSARQRVGDDLWNRAKSLASIVAGTLALRKKYQVFQTLTGSEFALDACITDKSERLVFDVTSPCLINHGMPILELDPVTGKYKVTLSPEYRIKRGDHHTKKVVQPVYWDLGKGRAIAYYA